MTQLTAAAQPDATTRRGGLRIRRGFLLLLGLVVIPLAIALITLPHGTPTDEEYVRMVFGTVAGYTVMAFSAVIALADAVIRRQRIVLYAIVAVLVLGMVFPLLGAQVDDLLRFLGS
ncbi:hypothetical protein [Microbacterium gorillae]|uniref:hypothetical protein n=1 Tax=Microbacterium gorillae TaxID=1231063 RepID=UPI00058F0B71|nr:hypothetical protein [Microbacterium gorillae]